LDGRLYLNIVRPGIALEGALTISTSRHLVVGILAFNEERQIRPSVEAALQAARAHPQATVVVVNDGSTDQTAAVLDALKGTWPEIVVIQHARNAGIAASAKSIAQTCTDSRVLIVPGDFTYDADNLTRIVSAIAANDEHRTPVVLGTRMRDRAARSRVRELAAWAARQSTFWCHWSEPLVPNYGLICAPVEALDTVPNRARGYGHATALIGVIRLARLRYETVPVSQVPGSETRSARLSAAHVASVVGANLHLFRERKRVISQLRSTPGGDTNRFEDAAT
jgi:hypothetical protein